MGNFDLRSVNFDVGNGQCLTIIGPNGCGKTTLLECIAGLNRPLEGKIIIDGADVTALPPEKRKIGYVPQDFVLFPHLTADQNVAFGLVNKTRKHLDKAYQVMHLLNIKHLIGRDVRTLSAGEKQKVALGRALAIDPKALLLDEPFSALDPLAKEKLRRELKIVLINILKTLDLPVIYVTHDLSEALLMSDQIAVMSSGRIEQIDSKTEVFENPKSHFVAEFLGFNVFDGRVVSEKRDDDTMMVEVCGVTIQTKAENITPNRRVTVVLKPQDILLSSDNKITKPKWKNCRCNILQGIITEISNMGSTAKILIDAGIPLKSNVSVDLLDELDITVGSEIFAQFRAQKVKLIPQQIKQSAERNASI